MRITGALRAELLETAEFATKPGAGLLEERIVYDMFAAAGKGLFECYFMWFEGLEIFCNGATWSDFMWVLARLVEAGISVCACTPGEHMHAFDPLTLSNALPQGTVYRISWAN